MNSQIDKYKDLILAILKKHDVKRASLFGSIVRKEMTRDSDIDLLVIMPSSKSGKEWWRFIYDKTERYISSDILVYNQEEIEEDIHHSRFLRNILECGKTIYEKA